MIQRTTESPRGKETDDVGLILTMLSRWQFQIQRLLHSGHDLLSLCSIRAWDSPFQTCSSLETPQLSSLVAVICFPPLLPVRYFLKVEGI